MLVHGDTTTTFVAALAAFFLKIPVGHVEAGLRTQDKYQPFPEEMNRHLAGVLTDYHFAPTPWARDNLLAEGVPAQRIWVTGNTVIDALQLIAARVRQEKAIWEEYFQQHYGLSLDGRRLILVTGHRRENFGEGFQQICWALRDIVENFPDLLVVYPVHLNPNVQRPVYEILAHPEAGCQAGVSLLETSRGQPPGTPAAFGVSAVCLPVESKLSGVDGFRGHSGRGAGPGETGAGDAGGYRTPGRGLGPNGKIGGHGPAAYLPGSAGTPG